MNLARLEKRLARYTPASPPHDLRDSLVETTLRTARGRRTAGWALAIALVMGVVAAFLNVQAERVYSEGVRMASCIEQPPVTEKRAIASILSLNVPNAPALLQWNGGSHE